MNFWLDRAKDKISFKRDENRLCLFLKGEWTYRDAKVIEALLTRIKRFNHDLQFDLTDLKRIDYAVGVLFKKATLNKNVTIINSNPQINSVFDLINDENIDFNYIPPQNSLNLFGRVGKKICDGFANVFDLGNFLGEFIIKTAKTILNPMNLRLREMSNYIKDSGTDAIFIVALTSFLIGIVLAYLGSGMLAKFGASIFIVEIMGMLTLREVGPLIAAIVIAGRSASSFTAQIGVMKITEEIDAMKTMGFDPFMFLVLPRIIAMVVAVPIVIFLADGVSILGQMLVCQNILDISFKDYLNRFNDMIEIRHFMVGMIKAPFFGAIIAIIGCMRGFGVSGSTESLGEMTTVSVVNAIFWVIAIDALFAIIFMEIGL